MVGLQVWVFGHQKPPHNGLHDKMHLCFRMLWSEKSCVSQYGLKFWAIQPSFPTVGIVNMSTIHAQPVKGCFFFFLKFFYYIYLFLCVKAHTPVDQKAIGSLLFTSNVDLGIKLGSSGLITSAFVHWAICSALSFCFSLVLCLKIGCHYVGLAGLELTVQIRLS